MTILLSCIVITGAALVLSILIIGLCMAASETRSVTEDTGDYE